MTRSHGPFGPPGAPPRRRPDDPFGAPSQQQPGGQWPAQPQHGYGDHAAPPPAQGGYHFPPQPEPQPAYSGYSNPQLLAPQQQWPPHADQQTYEINYQPYGGNDPSPFQNAAPIQHQGQHQGQQHGYGDADAEYGDGYYEDEEPRRGRRWILIAVALVGAIGVGGALAYTYRSLVAKSRLEAVKTDPNAKVRADQRKPVQVKIAEEAPPTKTAIPEPPAPAAQEDPAAAGESQGPRVIKTIPILPGGGAPAPAPAVAAGIPGITVYRPPAAPEAPPAPPPPATREIQAPPGGRVTLGTRPSPPPVAPPPAVEEEAPPPPPVKQQRKATAQLPSVGPKAVAPPPPPPRESSGGGQGYVAVLKSEKSQIDAMKTYADMQQRYPDVLGDRSFDVQEADLSSRNLGTMYRVVVGPPGSHNAAQGICSQLKAAGYSGCWVKEW